MPPRPVRALRYLSAALLTLSGLAQIGALWWRELNGAAVTDAVLGTVYLIVAIGLFGQSRFTLFMGIVIPAAAAAYTVQYTLPAGAGAYTARLAVDAIVILGSAVVLWRVRHDPSV